MLGTITVFAGAPANTGEARAIRRIA